MSTKRSAPIPVIRASAPVRICDLGGWTDTWFAERGSVLNLAIEPRVHVEVRARRREKGRDRHAISVDGQRAYRPPLRGWGEHPILEAALASAGVPESLVLSVSTRSLIPPGAGTGTSAAVTVALLGALDRLCGTARSLEAVAHAAHAVETELLGQQSGVQDQIAAAFGGILFIEVPEYPGTVVTRLAPSPSFLEELERRLVLIYLGSAHQSSDLHERVIRNLEVRGRDVEELEALRRAARAGREAIEREDLDDLAAAMRDNTEAQARLHKELVSNDARRVIDLAQGRGAIGWKVNGAGGQGGSLTLLWGDGIGAIPRLMQELEAAGRFRPIPLNLSPGGLEVRELNP